MRNFYVTIFSFFLFVSFSIAECVIMEIESEKHIEILDSPILGTALLALDSNGNVRWQTFKPYESIMISNGRGIFQFEVIEGKWRELESKSSSATKKVVEQIRRIVSGDYGEEFESKKTDDVLTLTPKNAMARNFLSKIEVKLRKNSRVPLSVEFVEPSNDKSVLKIVKFIEQKLAPTSIFDETKAKVFKITK